MFNLIMGIIMVIGGSISLAWGVLHHAAPFPVCVGCTLIVFGIVEIIRSRSIRQKKKDRSESEMDMYLRLADEMGVIVNPITKEVVRKQEQSEAKTEEAAEEIAEKTEEKTEEKIEEKAVEEGTEEKADSFM